VEASDLGGGTKTVTASVNGLELERAEPPCTGSLSANIASRLVPCPFSARLGFQMFDTSRPPFVNGDNEVSLCVSDFAGNGPMCESRLIRVDNQPPSVAFTDAQDPADPELIHLSATDTNSGLNPATAEVRYRPIGATDWTSLPTRLDAEGMTARVDSGAVPPGIYEFSATVADFAGNTAVTGLRHDGEPMMLTFPLREPVQLVSRLGHGSAAHETVAYGRSSQAQGRLLDADGEPMVGREVIVSEYFGVGALIDRRIRIVTTNQKGGWSSTLPAGPSRTVSVSFGGTVRYQPAAARSTELRVRSRATLALSEERVQEGDAVIFTGKVGHFGARVPPGGKLIELQVREGPERWNTVGEAFHTDSSGRFRLRYRFGRFYETNAHFVFRLKVAREQGWPYKAPGRSPSRSITVVANR
jgi:hypothetical protein